MPRSQRKRSESGFYHVVTKGDGSQILFENDGDRFRYLKILEDGTNEYSVEVHAYCLMSNHVHLLLQDENNDLSDFMKKLDEGYARYFSKNTGRVGHVFNGRFWSEPIGSDEHFLATLRYIHANPEPPGICRSCDYPWSSYRAYMHGRSFVRTDLALELLGGKEAFEEFHLSGGSFAKPFARSSLRGHLAVDELTRVAVNLLGRDVLFSIKGMKPVKRLPYFIMLVNSGFTEGEIARLTGIGQASIHRTLYDGKNH